MLYWDLEDVLDEFPDLMEFFNSLSRQVSGYTSVI